MVERIHAQQIAANAASLFEEVQQTADVVFAQFWKNDAHVGYTAVYVSQLSSQFGHFVHFVHPFAGKEVQAVQISFIERNFQFMVYFIQ